MKKFSKKERKEMDAMYLKEQKECCKRNVKAGYEVCVKCPKPKPDFKPHKGFVCKMLPQSWQKAILSRQ